ncbi:hypothetical protein LRR81_09095 [Metabacillus sp. GX 13764]|uniref:hypothetical protein n=1 Tax=Metabacillus kandeliae TaxID=2900151 RepID=UPI001E332B11|nr:hypothetical protein [Metabacillus kandeliae]MCD7034391.1 hypothetical protein [Metabacillus kandeliae]
MIKLGMIAAVLSIAGFVLTFAPFTSIAGWLQNYTVLAAGILCVIASLVLAIRSIIKKETGLLKFLPFVLLLPILYFAINFVSIMGAV